MRSGLGVASETRHVFDSGISLSHQGLPKSREQIYATSFRRTSSSGHVRRDQLISGDGVFPIPKREARGAKVCVAWWGGKGHKDVLPGDRKLLLLVMCAYVRTCAFTCLLWLVGLYPRWQLGRPADQRRREVDAGQVISYSAILMSRFLY